MSTASASSAVVAAGPAGVLMYSIPPSFQCLVSKKSLFFFSVRVWAGVYAENAYGPAPIGLVSISPVPICFGSTIAPSRWAIDSRKSEAPGALRCIVTCVGLSTITSWRNLNPAWRDAFDGL